MTALFWDAPCNYMGIPGTFKACLDRLLYATEHLEGWGPKPATAIAVCRRAGAVSAAQQLGNYLNCSNLITVNSQYWNIAFGWKPEEFLSQDAEGVSDHAGAGDATWHGCSRSLKPDGPAFPAPVYEKRVRANFCR